MKLARDVMTRNVYAVQESTDLGTLVQMLSEKQISGAPVLDRHGRPVGVVSLYDLVYQGGMEADPDSLSQFWNSGSHLPRGFHELGASRKGLTVRDIMTAAVHSVDEETPLSEVCEYFLKGQLHRVLVVRSGELSGIITSSDLIAEFQRGMLQAI